MPQLPFDPDPWCRMPYTSSLPDLATPLTVSVFWYEPYVHSLDSGKPWLNRVAVRSTTVLSGSWWPIVTPAPTLPRAVSGLHYRIRWRLGDFGDDGGQTEYNPSASPSPLLPTPTDTATQSSSQVSSLPPSSCTADRNCPSDSVQPPSPPAVFSNAAIAGWVIAFILCMSSAFFVLYCLARRRRRRVLHPIQLEHLGLNIGCLPLHKPDSPESEIVAE